MALSRNEWKRMLKKMPMLVVDGVVIENNRVLLVGRKIPPFLGHNVLPGGFVDYKETLEKAVVREVKEETGLRTKVVKFVGFYDNPERDPRGHTVSAAFLLKITGGKIRGSSETKNVAFHHLNKLPDKMGFDHKKMVKDALKMLRKRV